MSEQGFVKLYREIQEHPAWKAAPLKYRVFLIEFIFRMTFKEMPFVIGKSTIILKPNQYCSSADRMAEEFSTKNSQGKKLQKEDVFTRGDIRGAISFWKYHHFLTKIETNLLTNHSMVLEFRIPVTYENYLSNANQHANQHANQPANQRLTNVEPTKEEGEEDKDIDHDFDSESVDDNKIFYKNQKNELLFIEKSEVFELLKSHQHQIIEQAIEEFGYGRKVSNIHSYLETCAANLSSKLKSKPKRKSYGNNDKGKNIPRRNNQREGSFINGKRI